MTRDGHRLRHSARRAVGTLLGMSWGVLGLAGEITPTAPPMLQIQPVQYLTTAGPDCDPSCEPTFQGGPCNDTFCLDLWAGYCWEPKHRPVISPRHMAACTNCGTGSAGHCGTGHCGLGNDSRRGSACECGGMPGEGSFHHPEAIPSRAVEQPLPVAPSEPEQSHAAAEPYRSDVPERNSRDRREPEPLTAPVTIPSTTTPPTVGNSRAESKQGSNARSVVPPSPPAPAGDARPTPRLPVIETPIPVEPVDVVPPSVPNAPLPANDLPDTPPPPPLPGPPAQLPPAPALDDLAPPVPLPTNPLPAEIDESSAEDLTLRGPIPPRTGALTPPTPGPRPFREASARTNAGTTRLLRQLQGTTRR